MNTHRVEAAIHEIGLLPSVQASSADDGWFAVKSVLQAGIRTVEIEMTTPDALSMIERSCREFPGCIAGAGTVLDAAMARDAIAAGAQFLSLPMPDRDMLAATASAGVVAIVGGLTPTEVLTAWRAGAQAVKVFPCGALGGDGYIKALRSSFPDIPLIAAGGVTQRTAASFVHAGAMALGVGRAVIPPRAVQHRQPDWIAELISRFANIIEAARRGAM